MTGAAAGMQSDESRPTWLQRAFWPMLICGLLLMQIGLSVAAYVVANRDRTFAVETNYYKKAIEWDASAASDHAASALGWQTKFTVSEDKDGFRNVNLSIQDKSGMPLSGATVTMIVFHHAAPGIVSEPTLQPSAPGNYAIALPLARPGVWEFRYKIESNGVVATHHLQLNLQPGKPGDDKP